MGFLLPFYRKETEAVLRNLQCCPGLMTRLSPTLAQQCSFGTNSRFFLFSSCFLESQWIRYSRHITQTAGGPWLIKGCGHKLYVALAMSLQVPESIAKLSCATPDQRLQSFLSLSNQIFQFTIFQFIQMDLFGLFFLA